MIASKEFQNAYLDLYEVMRNYLWDVDTLEDLADVQLEIFTMFIHKNKLVTAMGKLYRDIKPTFEDDEELEEKFNALQSLVDRLDESQYAELYNTALARGGHI